MFFFLSQGKKEESGISVDVANKLLDDPLSLLDSSQATWVIFFFSFSFFLFFIKLFEQINWGWVLNGNQTYVNNTMNHFGLSTRQMDLLVRWIFTFTKAYAASELISKYGLTKLTDLAYLQYLNSTILDGQSITTISPPIQYIWNIPGTPIETSLPDFTLEHAKYVFETGPTALRNETNYIQLVSEFPFPDYKYFNLSGEDGSTLITTFLSYSQNYTEDYFTQAKKEQTSGIKIII